MSTAEKDFEEIRRAQEQMLTTEPRKLWRSVDELDSSFDKLKTTRAKEFDQDPTAKDGDDSKNDFNFSRRRFLQFMGTAGALMGAAGCKRRPVDHLVPYVHKPQGLIYGVPVWYASSSDDGVGILVKTREGRPIKLEGNPDHPVTQGGLDSQLQASLLDLYNPERLKTPMISSKATGWTEVDQKMLGALQNAQPGGVRILSSGSVSPTLKSLLTTFASTYKARHHGMTDIPREPILEAVEKLGGQKVRPTFHFDKADVIVSIDADFLGTWGRNVENTKAFSKRRKIHRGDNNVNRLFVFESIFTNTGIAADHRISISPSQQILVAKALMTAIDGGEPNVAGLDNAMIKEAARALSKAKGKALVVAGGYGPHSVELQMAALRLNQSLQSIGTTVDFDTPSICGLESTEGVDALIADMNAGKVDVLLIHGVNPVYSAPYLNFGDALSKVKTIATLSREANETTNKSTFILAESHFIETWGDSEIRAGNFAIQQPVIEPLYQTRSFGECLAAWTNNAQDYRTIVRNYWQKNIYAGVGLFDAWWMEQLKVGATKGKSAKHALAFKWTLATELVNAAASKVTTEGTELVLYTPMNLRDGTQANNAFLQELPDPISKVTWGNYIAVSFAVGKKLGIERKNINDMGDTRDAVGSVKVNGKEVKLPLFVQPGLKDNVVAIALGYGRKVAGTIGSNVGVNAYDLIQAKNGVVQLTGIKADLAATGEWGQLACTQKHFDIQGRDKDILQQMTLADFLKNPKAAKEGMKEEEAISLYKDNEFVYPEHKWGMAIDLNSCTGCQACVVACYTENNGSVVGPKEVSWGRHAAWLRLDLYYAGGADSAEATYEPMLCQQCDKAPCETVCPVLATVHTTDGLNAMVYNRCVGTRYCSNNCPYKVRRFNFFQYSDALAGKMEINDPLPMMLNPDVTVRSRGVMEKCTFCVQRLSKAKDEYKDKGMKVEDGGVKTACQQSCPADAIAFGDMNDPNSDVSKLAAKAQSFKVLEILNTKPNVSYLPRIRNKGIEA